VKEWKNGAFASSAKTVPFAGITRVRFDGSATEKLSAPLSLNQAPQRIAVNIDIIAGVASKPIRNKKAGPMTCPSQFHLPQH
jgi:hypothetical protein